MTGILEWIIFLALSLIAVITAAGMLLTMSMYRAGLALMASFVALAGLFILLGADLLAAIQIMMNVGGMLVMVLFMVMIMMDPGGEMMWSMKRNMHIRGLAAFSMSMPRGKPPAEEPSQENEQHAAQTADWTCPMHPEVSQPDPGKCPKCGMALISEQDPASAGQSDSHEGLSMPMHQQSDEQDFHTMHSGHELNTSHMSDGDRQMNMSGHDVNTSNMSSSDHQMQMSGHGMTMSNMGMTPRQYYDMMVRMAMSTTQLPWAIVLGMISALLLIVLVILTPWPLNPPRFLFRGGCRMPCWVPHLSQPCCTRRQWSRRAFSWWQGSIRSSRLSVHPCKSWPGQARSHRCWEVLRHWLRAT
jgi:hypothetical protein